MNAPAPFGSLEAASYRVIYADPPWAYHDASRNRGGAVRHYPVMTDAELQALPVHRLADPYGAFLLLWATWPRIDSAIRLIEAWGFRYRTLGFMWVKTRGPGRLAWGMGHYTRSNSEPCLLAVRGRSKVVSHGVHQVVMSDRLEHSRKPTEVRERIETLAGPDVRRVELFARECCAGWDAWGNGIGEEP